MGKGRKRFLSGWAAVLAALFAGQPLVGHAYALEGYYWATDENGVYCGGNSPSDALWNPCYIGVYLDPSFSNLSGWTGTALASMNDWQVWDASKNRYAFGYQYDQSGSTTNHVTVYASDMGGPNANGSQVIGQATYYGIPGFIYWGEMTYATVTINTHSNLTWCRSDGEGCSGTSWLLLEEDVDHELGHALGLAHPVQGPNSWAVMQCYQAQLEQTTVLSDDYTGAKKYYAGHTNDFGNPGSSPC